MISIFEVPVARFKLSYFEEFLCVNPWTDKEPTLSVEEIKAFMGSSSKRIPPGVFVDVVEDDFQLDNFTASREQHLARIAWFIDRDAVEPLECIKVWTGVVEGKLEPVDGYHRLYAKLFNQSETVDASIMLGTASKIEKLDGFVEWIKPPVHSDLFGSAIISTFDHAVELGADNRDRIWVNDAKTTQCVINMSQGRLLQVSSRHGQPVHYELDAASNVENAVKWIAELYPTFNEFRDEILNELKQCTVVGECYEGK
ncbi:hypothetical protein [Vibrio barjaei]|uniref:hypothetical protein n=1 Tax=Vibrio barjaei TaxID=1676683 RepID=UPI0022843B90|nr:hypothetical protein [Vibrio barjaei]MCY9874027.1 hypothetical protein [Vibrio barjaei]